MGRECACPAKRFNLLLRLTSIRNLEDKDAIIKIH